MSIHPREAYARLRNGEEARKRLRQAAEHLRFSNELTEDQLLELASELSAGSYYAYSMGVASAVAATVSDDLPDADTMLAGARRIAQQCSDVSAGRTAEFGALVAEHRVARNQWNERRCADIRLRIDDVRKRAGRRDDLPVKTATYESAAWEMELGHVERYQGLAQEATKRYRSVYEQSVLQLSHEYLRASVVHYLVSIPCEVFTLYLPSMCSIEHTAFESVRTAAAAVLPKLERARVFCMDNGFALLEAHHVKHSAAVFALLGRMADAEARLDEARSRFSVLSLQKPILICELFGLLMRAPFGSDLRSSTNELLWLAKRAKDYYPRVAYDAALFAFLLAKASGDVDGKARATQVLEAPPLFQSQFRDQHRVGLLGLAA